MLSRTCSKLLFILYAEFAAHIEGNEKLFEQQVNPTQFLRTYVSPNLYFWPLFLPS